MCKFVCVGVCVWMGGRKKCERKREREGERAYVCIWEKERRYKGKEYMRNYNDSWIMI